MAIVAVDSSDLPFQLSSIPVVDLRLFSQSELTSLSLCSEPSFDLRRCDDVVSPKIDRSIFNESAGSRKQTYSRLRLSRRPSDSSSASAHPRDDADAAERRENDQIVFSLRKLFAASDDGASQTPPPPAGTRRKANSGSGVVVYDNGSEIVNCNGAVVDVAAMASCEDPLGEELSRRTKGLGTREELIRFLDGLEGQWGSNRRKKKVVDAGEFGDLLPRGWKILVVVKKRDTRAWLICRKYISPNGLQFESYKDVSAYLVSLFGTQDASQHRSAPIDESSHLPTRSTAGRTLKDDIAKNEPVSYSVIPISSSAPAFSVSTEHRNQVVLFSVGNQIKAQQWNTLECRKCKLTFDHKDSYVEHLLSFHRKKARKYGLSKSISDGVVMRDGKYECQFCHKTFDERRRYNGHVGIHVKYYGKSLKSLPDNTTEQENNDKSSCAATPSTGSELDVSVSIVGDKNKVPETSTSTFNDLLNIDSDYSKQAMDSAVVNSPKCSELENTQEMSARKSVDKHEITDCSLLDPVKSGNAKDVEVEFCLDTKAALPTGDENAFPDVSHEKDLYRSSMLDKTSQLSNKPERELENCSITQPSYEPTHSICDVPDEKDICPSLMLDETSELGNNSERELEESSITQPNYEQTHSVCDVPDEKDLCPSLMLDEASELGNNSERELEKSSITQPSYEQSHSVCDVPDEKDLCPSLMLDETSELGNNPERKLENSSITQPSYDKIFGIGTYGDDIFTGVAKESMLDETKKSVTEQVTVSENCSTALLDNERACSADQRVSEILTSRTKEAVLDGSEEYKNELGSGFKSRHSVSNEVVMTEMVGSSGQENLLQNGVAEASPLLEQQSNFFPTLDSDKGEEKFGSACQKLSDFQELRFDNIQTPKLGFVTGQDSGSLSEAPMDLTLTYIDFEQGLDPTIQFEWDTELPKMVGGHHLSAVCIWCRVEFNLGGDASATPEMYPSVDFICPNCKAKSSEQLNLLDNGFSMNSD